MAFSWEKRHSTFEVLLYTNWRTAIDHRKDQADCVYSDRSESIGAMEAAILPGITDAKIAAKNSSSTIAESIKGSRV